MEKIDRMEAWGKLIGAVERYLEENNSPETPVINYKSGKDLSNILDLKIENEGKDLEGVMELSLIHI